MSVTCSIPLYALGPEPAAVLGQGHQRAGCGTMPPPLHRWHHTPHSFRHGGVAASFTAGVTDGSKISRYLGHGMPMSPYRLYGHLLPNEESEVTAKLSAARAKAEAEVPGRGRVRMVETDPWGRILVYKFDATGQLVGKAVVLLA